MRPLEGIRVLELTHMVSGPYAGMLLADLGAETIKVEPPEGEMTRGLMVQDPALNAGGMGPYFLSLNRNKKSVTLDLKSEAGQAIFYDLVKVSDVVLNNYRAGVMERLGIDHAQLKAVNPAIITCSITGFGEAGPDRDLPSYDMVVQAMSGVMSVTGDPSGTPARAGIPISDVSSSAMAVIGIQSALIARQRTGVGQHVDISMLDSQISAMNYMATIALMSGEPAPRLGSAHQHHVPYDVYPCRDGHLILAVVTDRFWQALVAVLDIPELDTDENRERPGRLKNRARIDGRLKELFAAREKAYWLARLRERSIPCAPVNNFLDAFAEPQLAARNMIVETRIPGDRSVPMPGNPVKLSGTPAEIFLPPAALGQHNREVLVELLGYPETELEKRMNK